MRRDEREGVERAIRGIEGTGGMGLEKEERAWKG